MIYCVIIISVRLNVYNSQVTPQPVSLYANPKDTLSRYLALDTLPSHNATSPYLVPLSVFSLPTYNTLSTNPHVAILELQLRPH